MVAGLIRPNRRIAIPGAGAWSGILGDSISDHSIPFAQWLDTVNARYGWNLINVNTGGNTSLETDLTDWEASLNCAIAQSATQAFHGTQSCRITSVAAGNLYVTALGGMAPTATATFAAGAVTGITGITAHKTYANAPTIYFVGGGGAGASAVATLDVNGHVNGLTGLVGGAGYTSAPTVVFAAANPQSKANNIRPMQASETWTVIFHVFIPVAGGVPANSVYAGFQDVTNAAVTVNTLVTAANTTGTWLTLTATRTFPAGAVQFFTIVGANAGAANQVFYVDGVQLFKGNYVPPTYTDFTERGSISGSTLSNKSVAANSAQNTMATRVTKHTAMNILFIMEGTNDLFRMSTSQGVATAISDVQAAWDVVFTAINGMGTPPLVVVLGLTNPGPNPANTGTFASGWFAQTVPPGISDWPEAERQLDQAIQQKAQQYGAIYVPIARRMNDAYLLGTGPHPNTSTGQQIIADAVITALEYGI